VNFGEKNLLSTQISELLEQTQSKMHKDEGFINPHNQELGLNDINIFKRVIT
jgi:hypothetical protein